MRNTSWMIIGAVVYTVTACSSPGMATNSRQDTGDILPPPPAIASIDVSPSSASIVQGNSRQLVATVRDQAGTVVTGQSITWKSSNTQVATVSSNGMVQAVEAGNVDVSATVGSMAGHALLTVTTTTPTPSAVASVAVSLSASTVTAGQPATATATLRDASSNVLTGRTVTWVSSNPSVATVSAAGQITTVAAGTTNIVATSEGVNGQATLTVNAPAPVPVATVTVALNPTSAGVGGTAAATATLRDANGNVLTGRSIQWVSSATSVATISTSGAISAIAAGTTTISATSEGRTGTATFTVNAPAPAPVATVTVALSPTSVLAGGRSTATATLRDAGGNVLTGRTITWQSSALGIATISTSGSITAVAAGTTTITATSEGRSGTATLTVTIPPPVDNSEPRPGASSTIVFQDDFESYDGTCLSMDAGPWRTSSGTCDSDPNGVISSPANTGYAGNVTGVGGRSARWIWPISTSEQFYPIEALISGFSGSGQAEYYTYWYKAPNFVYRTQYPRLGKKMFLLFIGDGTTGRVTINPSEFSIQPSNAAKVDSRFDYWPAGLTSEDAFLAYLTDGRWHRYTLMRLPETRDGAGDGALRLWVDGYLVIDRRNFGTYSGRTSSILLAGTFNGGSSKVQTEYYDQVVVWR